MAKKGKADVAILQGAGHPPGDLIGDLEVNDKMFRHPMASDRLPLVVVLSDNVTVNTYRKVPPLQRLPADANGVSNIGTIAVAKVEPVGKPDEAFIRSLDVRTLAVLPRNRPWRLERIGQLSPPVHFRSGHIHRQHQAGDTSHSGCWRSKYDLRSNWQEHLGARVGTHGLGSYASARLGVHGAPTASRNAPSPGIRMVDVPPDSKNVPTFDTNKQRGIRKSQPPDRLCVHFQTILQSRQRQDR